MAWLADKRPAMFGYVVCEEAKLSASEIPEVEEGKGKYGLRCNNLLTVCQRCLGFSENAETNF